MASEDMSAAERRSWRFARTLDDLGHLTAAWLTGEIASQSGYYGMVDVDEDDAPGLTATLVALNLAGYLTYNSQAGFDGKGYDGARWKQLAAVTGFADYLTLAWLRATLRDTRFKLIAHPVKRRFRRAKPGVVVTTRGGHAYTTFGWQLGRLDLGTIYYGIGDEAFAEVCDSWQVTIYDPQWGVNDLWPVLHRAAIDVVSS